MDVFLGVGTRAEVHNNSVKLAPMNKEDEDSIGLSFYDTQNAS